MSYPCRAVRCGLSDGKRRIHSEHQLATRELILKLYKGSTRAVMMQISREIFAGTYNMRARAHHTREKPNARNIFKAVSWCSAKLYFVIVCTV